MTVTERMTSLDGEPITLDESEIEALRGAIRGLVIRSGDAEYDAVRHVWNGMIDKRPAMIVRCSGTADVANAVRFARAHRIRVAVRGGHNVAAIAYGVAVCDGGLVIDLSLMKGIQVDPARRTARAQAGATWGDLDHETQLYGLATPGGEVSTTGIAGYTLSGGMGLLQRKWGLACDNLLSVEIVTADGEVLHASETEQPDLFWAVRGGGGNFGIVTWFEYRLYPHGPEVYSANAVYPIDDARGLLRAWRAFTKKSPDEVTSEALFWSVPPMPDVPDSLVGTPILILGGLFAGPAEQGEQALRPLREFGTMLLDLSAAGPYAEAQAAFDAFLPAGMRYYWKSLFLDDLSDDSIDAIVDLVENRPSPQGFVAIRHLGGAVGRVPEDATAYGNRHALYNLSLDTSWEDPGEDERMVDWTRAAWKSMRDRFGGGVYLNFPGLGEENDLLARAGYGRNYDRLQQVKRRCDPTNFFRGNINIVP